LTTGTRPVPESDTVCGLPAALSVMVRVAVRDPAAIGEKIKVIVQLPPAAIPVPQVLVWEKSPALTPVIVMLEIVSGPPPVFDGVMLCDEVVPTAVPPKMTGVARFRIGTTPLPVSETDSGLSEALSVIVTDAVRVPVAVGVNVTLIAQLAPATTELPHVLVCAKSPLFVPVTAMLEMFSAA